MCGGSDTFSREVRHLLDLHWSAELSTDRALSELLRDGGASIDNPIAGLSNCIVGHTTTLMLFLIAVVPNKKLG